MATAQLRPTGISFKNAQAKFQGVHVGFVVDSVVQVRCISTTPGQGGVEGRYFSEQFSFHLPNHISYPSIIAHDMTLPQRGGILQS